MRYLILEDRDGNIYNFDANFWYGEYSVNKNSNVVNTVYSSGGRETADQFPTPGAITIKGTIQGDTAALFETKKAALVQACIKGGKLKINDNIIDRYLEISWISFNFGILLMETDEGAVQDLSINFNIDDPLWKDSVLNESENILTGIDSFSIDTTGTDWLIKPIITISADQGADLTGVVLRNLNDGGASFVFNDEFFTQGSILIVDCDYGTVLLNNNDRIENFSGAFIRLQPGLNEIEYEGNACTITISYRKAYIR